MKTRADLVDEWNDLHIKLTKDGPIARNKGLADWCERLIVEADEAYYNTGTPIIEDPAYDMVRDSLKSLRPDSKILEKVGG